MLFCCACRLTGKLQDGTVFADHQTDNNLLELIVGEGERSPFLEICWSPFWLEVLSVISNAAGVVLWS